MNLDINKLEEANDHQFAKTVIHKIKKYEASKKRKLMLLHCIGVCATLYLLLFYEVKPKAHFLQKADPITTALLNMGQHQNCAKVAYGFQEGKTYQFGS